MNKYLIIVALSTLTFFPLMAQYTSLQGRFEVDQQSGCAPLTINLTINPPSVCDGSNPCDMDWNGDDTFPDNLVFTHTYTQPGTYWLQVLFQTVGLDSIQIVVHDDIPPNFDLYTCSGNQVSYVITDTNYDEYVVNFNDGSPIDVVPSGAASGTHTFAASGMQNITVRGRNTGAQDNCTAAAQFFDSRLTVPPPFIDELRVISTDQIELDFTNDPNVLYRLEMAVDTGPFQLVQDVYNSTTVTVPNLVTDDSYYCFRLGAFDPCANTTAYSNIICSADPDLTIQNNQNELTWTTNTAGISDIDIVRNAATLQNVTGTTNAYVDTDVICNTPYTYQLVSHYANGSISYSLPSTGTAISNTPPTPITDITASVQGASLGLFWIQDPNFTAAEYVIFKSNADGAFEEIGRSSLPVFTDDAYDPLAESCYQIDYTDVCGNESSVVTTACPVRLTATLNDDNSVQLEWSAYSGWEDGVIRYRIEQYNSDGTLINTYDAGTSLQYLDEMYDPLNQELIYLVVAEPVDGLLGEALSQAVPIIKEPNITHPTAFTPNGDGLNDTFVVMGQYVTSFRLTIYNRWGELIWATNDISDGWDGTMNGKVVPEGTYAFHADIVDLAGRTFNRTGAVLLLRKN